MLFGFVKLKIAGADILVKDPFPSIFKTLSSSDMFGPFLPTLSQLQMSENASKILAKNVAKNSMQLSAILRKKWSKSAP